MAPLGFITLNFKRPWGLLEPGKGLSMNLCRESCPVQVLPGRCHEVGLSHLVEEVVALQVM